MRKHERFFKIIIGLSVSLCAVGMAACEESENSIHTAETVMEEQVQGTEISLEEISLPFETKTEFSAESSVVSQKPSIVSKEPSEEPSKEVSKEITDTAQVSSVQQWFKMSRVSENMQLLAEQMSNDTQTTKIFPEGDTTIVLEITAFQTLEGENSEVRASLEKSFDAQKSMFIHTAQMFEQMTGIRKLVVSVRFKEAGGALLYQKDFTAGMQENSQPSETTVRPYDSLEEYLDSPAAYTLRNAAASLYDNDQMELYVFVEDETKLVYQYQLILDNQKDVSQNLEDSLKKAEFLFASQAADLKKYMETENLSVVVRYIDQYYNMLYEKEYMA